MIRVATTILFTLAVYQPVHADLRNSNGCGVPAEHSPASEAGICRSDLTELESEAHSACNNRQATLRRIAVYFSLGNRDGAEILIAQLRSEGISEDVLNGTINWITLHNSSSAKQPTEPTLPPVEPAW